MRITNWIYSIIILVVITLGFSLKSAHAQCSGEVLNISAPTPSQTGTTGNWTVPSGGPYKVKITAKGAKGGDASNYAGGAGASLIGEFIVNSGELLNAIAGAPGANSPAGNYMAGGGGGGSGVQLNNGVPLILAGGGGGAIYRNYGFGTGGGCGQVNNNGSQGGTTDGGGGGGGGFVGNGTNGSGGGGGGGAGGFVLNGGGGGGGYSGGNGNSTGIGGIGGGSLSIGSNQSNIFCNNNAGGQVIIECLGAATFTANFTPTQPICSAPTQGSLSIDLTGDNNGNTAGMEYAIVSGNSFTGTPTFADITSDPFNITSGIGTSGDFDGETYTVRIRLKYNPTLFIDNTYTLTSPPNTRTWTGNSSTDWHTANNWNPSCVPTADDDVSIPDVTNDPVISAAAVAKSVTVNSGAVLTIDPTGSLDVNGFTNGYYSITTALYNSGTVTNYGILNIGSISGAGQIGIMNINIFNNNTGGEVTINNTTDQAFWNFNHVATMSNAGNLEIGGIAAVDEGIVNQGSFTNLPSGEISIDNTTSDGIVNFVATGFSNYGAITIGATGNVGANAIKNTVTPFENSGCTASIKILSNSVILNVGVPAPLDFNNSGIIIENASGTSNITNNSGIVQNLNGGTFNITNNTGLITTFEGMLSACCPPADILYVNKDAVGANNGTSWADAYTDLQSALNSPCPNITQIWVAAGTYKPTTGTDRSFSFVMKNGVALYGGFNGTETLLSQRDWVNNETILSGDLQGDDGNNFTNYDDNSYNVVSGLTDGIYFLDGLVIVRGYSNQTSSGKGAGLVFWADNMSVTINNCIIRDNLSNYRGAGLHVSRSTTSGIPQLKVYNSMFLNNYSPRLSALDASAKGEVVNTVFTNNKADIISLISASLSTVTFEFINCTFHNNQAPDIFYLSGTRFIKNCIATGSLIANGSATFSNSIVSSIPGGSIDGGGNLIMADPLFVNAASGDLRLQPCSPAINAGDNASLPSSITTDLDGNPRFYNSGIVDMGAYEYQGIFIDPLNNIPPVTTQNGLNFDGVDDNVEIFDNCGSNTFFPSGNAITVAYWFKGSNSQSAVRMQNGGDYIVTAWNNSVHILSNDGGTADGLSVGTGFDDGNWHHITFTWQRNTVNGFKSYLDGQLVDQRNSSDTPIPMFTSGFYLGAFSGSSEFTAGTLDQVGVWTASMDQQQINSVMACGPNAIQPGLLHAFEFDHGTAGDNNSGINIAANSAMTNAPGVLQNFSLSGNTSNWIEGTTVFGNVIYVNASANGNVNGSSWTDAFKDLQDALVLAGTCSNVAEIWVAAGTYKPTSVTDRNISFSMKNGVAIYGGFNGTETQLSQRDWANNETILSGDIGLTGDNSDNSLHVILNDNNGLNNTAILDGFTITGGYASGGIPNNYGGGMFNINSSPSVSNCLFSRNSAQGIGGGIANYPGSPSVSNCIFSGNSADIAAGGMFNYISSSPTLTNCIFSGNSAGMWGGAISSTSSSLTITNCSFSGNSAGTDGGVMLNNGSSPIITNCILWGNSSGMSNTNGGNPVI